MSSGLENKLRAALRDTADEIPAAPPPQRLPPGRGSARPGPVWPGQRRWISWAAPLAAAALVLAVVAVSLAVVRGGPGRAMNGPDGLAAVPPYYVALTAPAYPDVYDGNATVAEVRATATGAVLARVVPPRP
jgi:negative regulator of sigma E activity